MTNVQPSSSVPRERDRERESENAVAKLRLVQRPSGVLLLNVLWDRNSPSQDKTAETVFSLFLSRKQTSKWVV